MTMFPRFSQHWPLSALQRPKYTLLGHKQEAIQLDQEVLPRSRFWFYFNFILGILVGTTFTAFVVVASHKGYQCSRTDSGKEFAPEMPLKTITFGRHRELYARPSAESDAAWNALMPLGDQHKANGWVLIPNPQDYNLQPGVPVPELGVDRYALSMYHQLHCLRAVRDMYWKLVGLIENGLLEDARKEVKEQLHNEHALHCFAYLVQGVQCSADLSVEWASVGKDGKRTQTGGVGVPHHHCKDPEAVKEWVAKHHTPSLSRHNLSH